MRGSAVLFSGAHSSAAREKGLLQAQLVVCTTAMREVAKSLRALYAGGSDDSRSLKNALVDLSIRLETARAEPVKDWIFLEDYDALSVERDSIKAAHDVACDNYDHACNERDDLRKKLTAMEVLHNLAVAALNKANGDEPSAPHICGMCMNTYEECTCAKTGRR